MILKYHALKIDISGHFIIIMIFAICRSQRGSGPNFEDDKSQKWQSHNVAPKPQSYSYPATNTQQSKPPRFQRNDEAHNYYQRNGSGPGNFNNAPTQAEYKHFFPQPNLDIGSNRNHGNNSYGGNARSNTLLDSKNKNYELSQGKLNRSYQVHLKDVASDTSQRNNSKLSIDNEYMKGMQLNQMQSNENQYANKQANAMAGAPWVWQKGDKCMAKYWEDNMVCS